MEFIEEVMELLTDEWLYVHSLEIPDKDWDEYYMRNMGQIYKNIENSEKTFVNQKLADHIKNL